MHFQGCIQHLRDTETVNIPFSTALTGALRRCSSLVWPATPRSERLALHPASTAKNGTLTISVSLIRMPWTQPPSRDALPGRLTNNLSDTLPGWYWVRHRRSAERPWLDACQG